MTAASPPSKSHSVTSISKNSPVHDALKSRDPLDFFGGGGESMCVWGRSLNQILGAKGDVWLCVFAPPLGVDPLSVHPVKGLSAAGVEPQSGGERRSSGCISRVFVSECVRADGPGVWCSWRRATGRRRRWSLCSCRR